MGNPTVYTDLLLNDKKAREGLKDLKGDFSTWSKDLDAIFKKTVVGMAAALAAAFAGAGIGAWMVADIAANAQEVENKFNIVFSNLKDEAADFAQSLSDYTGQSLTRMQRAVGGFGDLLKPIGIDETSALNYSKNLTKLAADIASFNDVPFQQVLEDITSALNGGHEAVAKYGIVLNEVMLKTEGVTTKSNAAEKAIGRINLMMKMSGDAHGAVARNLGSLMDTTNRFWKDWENTLIQIGKVFVPIKIGILEVGQAFLGKFAEGSALMTDVMLPAAESLGEWLSKIAKTIEETEWGEMGETFGAVWDEFIVVGEAAINTLWDILTVVFGELGKEFGAEIVKGAFTAGKTLEKYNIFNPIGMVKSAYGEIYGELYGEEKDPKTKILNSLKAFQDVLEGSGERLGVTIGGAVAEAFKEDLEKDDFDWSLPKDDRDFNAMANPQNIDPFTGLPIDLPKWSYYEKTPGGETSDWMTGSEDIVQARKQPIMSGVGETYSRLLQSFLGGSKDPDKETADNTKDTADAAKDTAKTNQKIRDHIESVDKTLIEMSKTSGFTSNGFL